jgi:hypothetical protein
MPTSLQAWLPEKDMAWFIIDVVEQMDLSGSRHISNLTSIFVLKTFEFQGHNSPLMILTAN